MSMSDLVSAYFTNDTADQDLEKQAQVELFAKLAASNGIDLNQVSEDQLSYLWDETFKTAEADEPAEPVSEDVEKMAEAEYLALVEEAEEAEKLADAQAEFEFRKEAATKIAEADYLGRRMAHALTDELAKIAADEAAAREAPAMTAEDEAEAKLAGALGRLRGMLPGSAARKAAKSKEELMSTLKAVGGLGAAAAVGATGAKLHSRSQDRKRSLAEAASEAEKTSAALDHIAAEVAVIKAAEAGWDPEDVSMRVSAVLTLGVTESEKVASAQSFEQAVDIRSLELLTMAGYDVNWNV